MRVRGADARAGYASCIADNLWQGGYPADPQGLWSSGTKVLVIVAKEHRPEGQADVDAKFPGVAVICSPLDDDGDTGPTASEARRAKAIADIVVEQLRDGHRVLVTCHLGRNRSGLVTGLVLVRQGMTGLQALEHVRRARANALCNPSFARFIAQQPAGGDW